jgi:hypothetical protein
MDKVEFYKNRNLGDRFSDSAKFIRQNAGILFKYLFLPAFPIILIQAFCSLRIPNVSANPFVGADIPFDSPSSILYSLLNAVLMVLVALYLPAMSGALMSKYEEGSLTKETKFKDLSDKLFFNMKKFFGVVLLFGAIVLVISLLVFIFVSMMGMVGAVLFVILCIAFIVAIVPSVALSYFPAFFQETGVWDSINKAVRLGFKYWGSTFVTIFIAGIITALVTVVFQLPNVIYLYYANISGNNSEIVAYILTMLSSSATLLVTPMTVIFLAFQYFSIVEKEEGISLQSRVEEFDNL